MLFIVTLTFYCLCLCPCDFILSMLLCLSATMWKSLMKKVTTLDTSRSATFLFQVENTFWSRKSKCQIKLKFGAQTSSNMQNSMMVFILSVGDQKYPYCANLVQKIKIFRKSNSDMLNSMVILFYLLLARNTLFGQIWSRN